MRRPYLPEGWPSSVYASAGVTVVLIIGALCIFQPFAETWSPDDSADPQPYIEPDLTAQELQECQELNSLEALVDSDDIEGKEAAEREAVIAAFQLALETWRSKHPGTQPQCRTAALGKTLCHFGARLPEYEPIDFWSSNMAELRKHVSTPEYCSSFGRQYDEPPYWKPDIFNMVLSVSILHIDRVFWDPDYPSVYSKAGHLAAPYGPPQQLVFQRHGFKWNKKRMQNLNHFRALRLALPDWELSQVDQFVEFGAGTGDLAPMLWELGFRGTHLAIDLPPMILLQYYWHRFSGIPSLLGQTLPCDSNSARNHIVLESSANTTSLECHLDSSLSGSSLFFATFSFTEADMLSRERIRPLIENFGIIFLAFWPRWENIDNDKYLQQILDAGLESTHHTLAWKTHFNGFYFIARRRDLGPVACNINANCHWYTLHAWLPRGGLVHASLKWTLLLVLSIAACRLALKRLNIKWGARSIAKSN